MSYRVYMLCVNCWNWLNPKAAVKDPARLKEIEDNRHFTELCEICQQERHVGIALRMGKEEYLAACNGRFGMPN